ncbi:MAG TPA: glycosyl hydrolase family 28 protein [Anaerolineae bacterium]|nr:glycosyl hydrolase family 28 protein [Anaerolineae bacterium]
MDVLIRTVPALRYSVRDYGAKGDGATMDTQAIQAAIDTCTSHAGGTVFFPAGTYLTGTIVFKDNVTLYFAPEATLLGSKSIEDYAIGNRLASSVQEQTLIFARHARNIGLAGQGMVDGQGWAFPCGTEGFNVEDEEKAPRGKAYPRPRLLDFLDCQGITIRDLTLKNAASWCTRIEDGKDIRIDGVKVDSRQNQNTDGFHLVGCENVFISNCDMNCGDDAFPLSRSARNIVITNCVITSRWAAFRMGPYSTGVFKDIAVSNCIIRDTYGCGIKLQMVEGGAMEDIVFDNLVMEHTTGPISIRLAGYLGWKRERKESYPTGKFRNVLFSNIRASVPENSCPLEHEVVRMPGELRSCMNITGLPGHPVEGVTFSNVHITYAGGGTAEEAARRDVPEMKDHYPEYHMFGTLPAYGLYVRHAKGLTLHNVRFDLENPDLRPAVVCDDVEDLELAGLRAEGHPQAEALIRLQQTRGAFIHGCRPLNEVGTFLRVEGEESGEILLTANDLAHAASTCDVADGAREDAVK